MTFIEECNIHKRKTKVKTYKKKTMNYTRACACVCICRQELIDNRRHGKARNRNQQIDYNNQYILYVKHYRHFLCYKIKCVLNNM